MAENPDTLRAQAKALEFRARISSTPGYRFIWARRANALRRKADIIEAARRLVNG